LSVVCTFHYTTDTQVRNYKHKKSPTGQPPGIRDHIPTHSHNRQTSSRASNTRAKLSVTIQCHSKLELFRGNSKKQLHSIPTHPHSVSQQRQNGFQKHLQIRFETMESTAEPIQSNQQETSNDNQQRQPFAVTHPNLCAAITSWQNKNTIQSQKFTFAKSKSNRNLTSILQ
jgi:hypothetical protein